MTIAATLNAVADLLTPSGSWTREHLALDALGDPVGPTSPDAVCFCFEGAIHRVIPPEEGWKTVRNFVQRHLGQPIFVWNDALERTKDDVVAMARSLARQAEKECI